MEKVKKDERVTAYIKAVKAAILKDYDKIPDEWQAQLQLLSDTYATYLRCSDQIPKEEVVVAINAGKTKMINPLITLSVQLIKTCDLIIKSFGLNPIGKSRLNQKNVNVADAEDFLDTL